MIGKAIREFVVTEELSSSSYGRTFRAARKGTEASVIIKQISASELSPKATERLTRSLAVLKGVGNPHVARVLDVFTDEGSLVVVSEYVEGTGLDALLSAHTLSEAQAVAMGIALCGGLAEMHRVGVIHRDIKPANIIIPKDSSGGEAFDRAVLIDLAATGVLDHVSRKDVATTGVGQLFGTPTYMAPEQFQARPQSTATDVYGIGMVLYESLCGETPFSRTQSENVVTLMLAVLTEPAKFPKDSSVSEHVQGAVLQCLAKETEARPPIDRLPRLLAPPAVGARGPYPSPGVLPFDPHSYTGAEITGAFARVGSSATVAPPPPDRVPPLLLLGAVVAFVLGLASPGILGVVGGALIAGVALRFGFSVLFGVLVHAWIERQRPKAQIEATALFARALHAGNLRKSIALDLEALVIQCRSIDQRILLKTIGAMLEEYDRSKRGSDRQSALMKATELLEKLMQKLAPWHVRHQKLIALLVPILGAMTGITKLVVSIVHAH